MFILSKKKINSYLKMLLINLIKYPMSYGVIPYFLTFIYYYCYNNISFSLFVPLIVFINGILYHSIYPNNKIVYFYDTIINSLLILYLVYISTNNNKCNYYESLPYVFIVFITNSYINSSFIHVIGVQLILLDLYIKESPYLLIP